MSSTYEQQTLTAGTVGVLLFSLPERTRQRHRAKFANIGNHKRARHTQNSS